MIYLISFICMLQNVFNLNYTPTPLGIQSRMRNYIWEKREQNMFNTADLGSTKAVTNIPQSIHRTE
jgi:hypothetical protein